MSVIKLDKAAVGYSKGMPSAHCSICRHFSKLRRDDQFGACERVHGSINVAMWCNLFEAKR